MPDRPPYRHIFALVHLDGRDDAVIGQAHLLAGLCGAQLDLLHLVDLPPAGDGYPVPGRAQTAAAYEAAAHRRMAFLASRYGLEAEHCHARHGPAERGFRDFVRLHEPDLLVVAHDQAEFVAGPWDVLALRTKSRAGGWGLLDRLRNLFAAHRPPAHA